MINVFPFSHFLIFLHLVPLFNLEVFKFSCCRIRRRRLSGQQAEAKPRAGGHEAVRDLREERLRGRVVEAHVLAEARALPAQTPA